MFCKGIFGRTHKLSKPRKKNSFFFLTFVSGTVIIVVLWIQQHVPLAQLVEHLTFNQRARDSSSRRRTRKCPHRKLCGFSFLSYWKNRGKEVYWNQERGVVLCTRKSLPRPHRL